MVKQLDKLPSDPAAAAAIRSLLGETEAGTSAAEIAWGFRKLLEEQAHERPLVCLFDDIQWGEETFLDLIDPLAVRSRASLLLVCLARPELVERRPRWRVALRLEPLPDKGVGELVPETLPTALREKISRAAGGNPLFVTEMVAMADETEGDVAVPPTLRALLAARLDQLDPAERFSLERGAVEGEIFHRGAVEALSGGGQVMSSLASLVDKALIRSDRPQLEGEAAFRFRHLLIRDAAYDAMSKATRAQLHERFVGWLGERGTDVAELDQLLGYHLAQAASYKDQLGQRDPALAERAGERLAAGGRHALWRGDLRAAAPLLERALELLRPLRLDVHLELDLASVETLPKSVVIAESVAASAHDAGDEPGEALAHLFVARGRTLSMGGDPTELDDAAHRALPLLERAGDHAGLKSVWQALAFVANCDGHFEEWERASEQALHHSRLAGEEVTGLLGIDEALVHGPRPADDALRRLDELTHEAWHPTSALLRSGLVAMLGRVDEAWIAGREAGERFYELTGWHRGEQMLAEIAMLRGDYATAAELLSRFCAFLEEVGNQGVLSTSAPRLGRVLCALGDYEQAERLAQKGRELGDSRDFATQALWRQVRALVCAHRSELGEAEALAREAVEIVDRTDVLNHQGDALCDLAEVLAAAGHTDEAAAALEQALERYERKKNLAMIAQVRPRLGALQAGMP